MKRDFERDEPSLRVGDIERRNDPRGIVRDLHVVLADGVKAEGIEASPKGFFISLQDPDALGLGTTQSVKVSWRGTEFECRVEVIRKEIEPRRGVALRIVHITPVAEETFRELMFSPSPNT